MSEMPSARRVGRPKKDPIFRLGVMAWYQAVKLESGNVSERDLDKALGYTRYPTGLWYKYARGLVEPRAEMVSAVEARYSGTAKWLSHPLWSLVTPRSATMDDVERAMRSLQTEVKSLLVENESQIGSSFFWRKPAAVNPLFDKLAKMRTIDAGIAMLALVREAEITRNRHQHIRGVKEWSLFLKDFSRYPILESVAPSLRRYHAECMVNTDYSDRESALRRRKTGPRKNNETQLALDLTTVNRL